ncbi:MAG: hypothetical protein AB7M12_04485 [Hyphomonadaceae bacterium]
MSGETARTRGRLVAQNDNLSRRPPELRFALFMLQIVTVLVSFTAAYLLVSSFDPPLWAWIEAMPALLR